MNEIVSVLQSELNIPARRIETVLEMLEEGATVPFIARYRKEQTGGLDEDQIRQIEKQHEYQQNLFKRKEAVLALIEEKGLLSAPLKEKLLKAATLAEVEDLYRPYKEKKKTKASAAIAAGLEPLAEKILTFPAASLESLGSPEELEGAGYIIAERMSDDADTRKWIHEQLLRQGQLVTRRRKDAEDENGRFEMYYEHAEPVRTMPPHRIMAINRGEDLKILSVSIEIDQEAVLNRLARQWIRRSDVPAADFVRTCAQDALKRLILPSVKRLIRSELSEKAEEASIAGFSDNLEHLLLQRPVKKTRVLGFDPGYAHGCKLACVDENGTLLETSVIYPTKPRRRLAEARQEMERLIRTHRIQLVAIGNGTASRESEAFVASLCKEHPDLRYTIVSEAGASVYSASPLGAEEFPDLPIETRSAVSIARRIQDPLSELVKIDAKSIGVGEYQHDVSQKKLGEALDFTTSKVVNQVGINVNTASPSILRYVSGLNKASINKLCSAKNARPLRSRAEIAAIKGISPRVYEQCIGFLRIPESANPLDNTGIHPESYELTRRLLAACSLELADMKNPAFKTALRRQNPLRLASQIGADRYTVIDIIKELLHPGLDPRDELEAPLLRASVLSLEDLRPGMELQGTVRNVTSFGAFVDVGVHDDGLVHISKLSDRKVTNPHEVVHTGQIVTCWVEDVDLRRHRLALTMKKPV